MTSQQNRSVISRRRLAALLAMPAIVGRSADVSGAGAPRKVTIAGITGWFQVPFDSIVLAAFRQAHRDIEVSYLPVGDAFQTLAFLRRQRASPPADVVLLEAGVAATATAEGLLTPLTVETMPVLKDLIPQAIIANCAGPGLLMDSLALGYGPNSITQVPRYWRNLWDPAFGSRIALQVPPDPLGLATTALAGRLFGGADMLHGLELGIIALEQLAPRVVLWDPEPDIYKAVARGEAGIGPGWNAPARAQAALTPGQFAVTLPNEGSPTMVRTVNLVKNCHQPEAARTLIAWLLGPEAQRLLTEGMFFAPVNTKADMPRASLERVGATPEMVARRMPMDWVVIDGIRDQISEAWRKQNLSGG